MFGFGRSHLGRDNDRSTQIISVSYDLGGGTGVIQGGWSSRPPAFTR